MANFQEQVKAMLSEYGEDAYVNDIPNMSLPYSVCYLPKRKLAFHLIPFPEKSIDESDRYVFQLLALKARDSGIRLIQLHEDIWHTKRTIVRERIGTLLGKFERIHARKTKVGRISKPEAADFLSLYHLQGSPNARYKYGLHYNGELVAVATFSAARPIERNGRQYQSFELVRFANKAGVIAVGGLGKLINHFVKEVSPDDIMTYLDLDWGWGEGYEQLGFVNTGTTPPQEFWLCPATYNRYYPHKLPPTSADCEAYRRTYNAGNIKYLLLLT